MKYQRAINETDPRAAIVCPENRGGGKGKTDGGDLPEETSKECLRFFCHASIGGIYS